MTHRATPRFWRCYDGLPEDVRTLADRSYALLKTNPHHPSLHFKKVGQFWSSRVGLHYRALAVEAGDYRVWFWIGSHADYDKLIGQPVKAPQSRTRGPRPRKTKRAKLVRR